MYYLGKSSSLSLPAAFNGFLETVGAYYFHEIRETCSMVALYLAWVLILMGGKKALLFYLKSSW